MQGIQKYDGSTMSQLFRGVLEFLIYYHMTLEIRPSAKEIILVLCFLIQCVSVSLCFVLCSLRFCVLLCFYF